MPPSPEGERELREGSAAGTRPTSASQSAGRTGAPKGNIVEKNIEGVSFEGRNFHLPEDEVLLRQPFERFQVRA